ncbi:MAG: serine/threonine protein kinase with repeat [Myxococcaceae bacterium]|nr:serine/threonine protein kinase with repeat [Myxococcaceae bacterium]
MLTAVMPLGNRTTVSKMLDVALSLPAERRAAWVDSLGLEFAPLKPRLHELLARSVELGSSELLQTLPKLSDGAASTLAHFERSSHRAGDQIGPYCLRQRLGVGAMGVVWCAERMDGIAPRMVALKFAHVAPLRSDLQARLAREHDLMSALNHPNVARLYDAGRTAEGQPYLVLEYVAGCSLLQFCEARGSSIEARLQLFLQLAGAVAHAHECQIVHRDLKPANVLVTADGTVRLLDFGIAKLLSEGVPVELQLSRLTGQPLTPAYASPEQVLGLPAGLPSDVYSLGVMLYELLTGERPFAHQRSQNLALRRAIIESRPVPPSERSSALRLALPHYAQLDAIVMKALEKLPLHRHASARELTIELAGLPV